MSAINESLDELSRAQHGMITGKQALQWLTPDQLKRSIQRQQFIRVYRGVYRMAGSPFTWRAQVLGAVLAAPSPAVASHGSALMLHGLLPGTKSMPHVSVTRANSSVVRGVHVHRSKVEHRELTIVDRIPVVAVERAIADAAASCGPFRLGRLVDDAVVGGKTTYVRVLEALDARTTQGLWGVAKLRLVLSERVEFSPFARSKLVTRLQNAVRKAGLVQPILEHAVFDGPQEYYLDAAWPEFRIAVELDGFSSHGLSRKAFDEDRRRQNFLVAEGWTVLRFTATSTIPEIVAVLRATFRKAV